MVWERMIEPKDGGGMGSRDLEAFNTALLGKQIWRLITKPNLLMSKVIRGKYFPNGIFSRQKVNHGIHGYGKARGMLFN